MIKNMDKEYINGLMVDSIQVDLLTVNNTVKEFTNKQMEQRYTEFGKRAKKVYYVKIVLSTWI